LPVDEILHQAFHQALRIVFGSKVHLARKINPGARRSDFESVSCRTNTIMKEESRIVYFCEYR
jgi:hypothetical protein